MKLRRSKGLVELADQLVHFRLQLRKLPRLVLLLQLLPSADHAQQQAQVHAFLGGGQRALAGLDLHVVEVDQFFDFEAHGIGDVLLYGFGLGVDVWHDDDVLVGDLPEGLLLLLCHLVGGHLDVLLGKAPPLAHCTIQI